jgi:hypothetical protein
VVRRHPGVYILEMDAATNTEFNDLKFSIEKSLRYHQRRRAFYESSHRWLMFTIIVLGSAGASALVPATLIAFAAALVGAIDLVWSPGSHARDHLVLHQSFSTLLAEMVRTTKPDADGLAEWRGRRVEIEANEPPIYWALEKDCYNEICRARGTSESNKLTWAERHFMNVYRFERVSV